MSGRRKKEPEHSLRPLYGCIVSGCSGKRDSFKSLREQHRLTQTELAKRLGITRSSVNAWELGISVPSTQYIVELAELFQVSADYLLGIRSTSTISVRGLTQGDIAMVCGLVEHLRKKNHALPAQS